MMTCTLFLKLIFFLVSGQPQELAEFISPPGPEILAAGPAPPRAVVAQNPLHQGSVSVTPTTDMGKFFHQRAALEHTI